MLLFYCVYKPHKPLHFFRISSEKMLKAWKEMEEKAIHYAEVGVIGYLEAHIMSLNTEIMELQQSPYR